jgi:hypothetical protein
MQYAAQLEGTQGISFGTSFAKVDPVRLRFPDDTKYLVNQIFSGVYWDALTDNYSYDSMISWQITRPYPANIIAIEAFLMTMDK